MSEQSRPPINLRVGYGGKIDATWFDSDASWVCDYFPHPDPEMEEIKLVRRREQLLRTFNKELFEPSIELVKIVAVEPESEPEASHILRVSTLIMPYVDMNLVLPAPELRMPAPTAEEIERFMIEMELRAGGNAIFNSFATAMTPPKAA